MAYRFYKIYTTDTMMDAYVLVGYFESEGIPALLIQGNSIVLDRAKPLENVGIKIFVEYGRRDEAVRIFKERLGAQDSPPYTGPIAIFTGRTTQEPTLIPDPRGEEHLQWDMGTFDPLASMDFNPAPAKEELKCPYCQAPKEKDSRFCDQCGERID